MSCVLGCGLTALDFHRETVAFETSAILARSVPVRPPSWCNSSMKRDTTADPVLIICLLRRRFLRIQAEHMLGNNSHSPDVAYRFHHQRPMKHECCRAFADCKVKSPSKADLLTKRAGIILVDRPAKSGIKLSFGHAALTGSPGVRLRLRENVLVLRSRTADQTPCRFETRRR
jgi:hypothetical protein